MKKILTTALLSVLMAFSANAITVNTPEPTDLQKSHAYCGGYMYSLALFLEENNEFESASIYREITNLHARQLKNEFKEYSELIATGGYDAILMLDENDHDSIGEFVDHCVSLFDK